MPNFTATLRTNFRDVSGLVFSAGRADIVEDPTNPGYAMRWTNKANGLPSIPEIRQYGDPVLFKGVSCTDAYAELRSRQPQIATLGGQKRLKFVKAQKQYLRFDIENQNVSVSDPTYWTGEVIAFQFEPVLNTGKQTILASPAGLVMNRDTFNDIGKAFFHGSGIVVPDLVNPLPAGRWMFKNPGSGAGKMSWSRDGESTSGLSVNDGVNAPLPSYSAFIGKSDEEDPIDEYLDGYLDSMHIWKRRLSPLELDFIWKTIDENGVSYAQEIRAPVVTRVWTDATANPLNTQIDRVRSSSSSALYYKLATVSNNGDPAKRVQIAASVNGFTRPDSQLGGKLFSLYWVEVPGSVPAHPVVVRDTGWSSVFDCLVSRAGHYCAAISRPDGGSVYLHFDVEVTP